jgi:hypothetical protein
MKTLNQLKTEILADGIIDAAEVKEIEEVIYSDGVIDQEEADFLFELNDAVSEKENDHGWASLFIEAITSFLLDDETSPGEIDSDEAEWLFNKVQGDGQVDDIEKKLLLNLKEKAKSFPSLLEELL